MQAENGKPEAKQLQAALNEEPTKHTAGLQLSSADPAQQPGGSSDLESGTLDSLAGSAKGGVALQEFGMHFKPPEMFTAGRYSVLILDATPEKFVAE